MNNLNKLVEKNFKKLDNIIYFNNSYESFRVNTAIDTINRYNTTLGISYANKSIVNEEDEINNIRLLVKKHFNASNHDVIFTKNTTSSINLVSNLLSNIFNDGAEVIVTDIDHVSNISPWKSLTEKLNGKLIMAKSFDGKITLSEIKKNITKKTKLISIPHLTNTFSSRYEIKEITDFAKSNGIITFIDGAQSAGKIIVDIDDLGCDFYTISTHKMFAGTGGILIGNSDVLRDGNPIEVGGRMHSGLNKDLTINYLDSPHRYESGTKNISSILSIRDSINFLDKLDMNEVTKYLEDLKDYATKKLEKIKDVEIINKGKSVGNLLFNVKDQNHEDIRRYLDSKGIVTRSGFVCSNNLNPTFKRGFVRISFHIYNNKKQVDYLVEMIKNGGDWIEYLF